MFNSRVDGVGLGGDSSIFVRVCVYVCTYVLCVCVCISVFSPSLCRKMNLHMYVCVILETFVGQGRWDGVVPNMPGCVLLGHAGTMFPHLWFELCPFMDFGFVQSWVLIWIWIPPSPGKCHSSECMSLVGCPRLTPLHSLISWWSLQPGLGDTSISYPEISRKLNIILMVGESIRFDNVDPRYMPHMMSFAERHDCHLSSQVHALSWRLYLPFQPPFIHPCSGVVCACVDVNAVDCVRSILIWSCGDLVASCGGDLLLASALFWVCEFGRLGLFSHVLDACVPKHRPQGGAGAGDAIPPKIPEGEAQLRPTTSHEKVRR